MHTSAIVDTPAEEFFGCLIAWANTRAAVRAVLVTSTRAIPGAAVDILSDYDVILVVKNISPWVREKAWLDDFGQVLVAYWDPIHPDPFMGIEVCSNVVQYSNGLKIDFNLWPIRLLQQITFAPALPDELDAGYRILLDKDQHTVGMQAPTGKAYVPKPPTLAEYQTLINDFLSDAPYVAKCLWRDELLPAKLCLDYDMKYIYLRRVLEWSVELEHDWSVPVGALGKGLKKYLPPEIWKALERCYADADIQANWLALSCTMDLFRQVATMVGVSLGYRYLDDLHGRVQSYVEQIQNLPSE